MKLSIPAELKPENVIAIIDTREQLPLCLDPLAVEVGTLATGDYSVKGLESVIAIERKSLQDLLGGGHDENSRFMPWRSKITPSQAIGSLLGWIALGIPVIMAGDHERAGRYVSRLLFTAARRRWREARALAGSIILPMEANA